MDSASAGSSGGSGGGGACGWGSTGVADPAEGYVCGGSGEDPDGDIDMACPAEISEGEACGTVVGEGCCDADDNVWYCSTNLTLIKETC